MKYFIGLIFLFSIIFSNAQQTDFVDFKSVESVILFNQINVDSTVFNSYEVKFDILKQTDSIYLDAINMRFESVALNGKSVKYNNDDKKLIIYNEFEALKSYKLSFLFFTSPRKAMYFIGWDNASRNQIWTQGQGKYTSHWLPSLDDTNDKIEFDLTFVAPKGYEVISNGKMVSKTERPSYNLWKYDMLNPMSSYLVAVAMGKYNKKVEYSKSGIPLEMYYYPEDSLKFEPTYRYTKQMFDFLEEEIDVPYPWQNYKQVPVKDFLYSGMENTSVTIFSDAFVIDSTAFVDKNYVNVNAHELAHQWFGDLVTAKSGEHHWLQEGFATYYALLAERNVFGDDYYYWRLYEYAQELLEQDKAGQSTSLLNPKSSSTTFYKKGAWVLHMLREEVGDKAFKTAVKSYLEKHQFESVETNDFISEVEKASGENLNKFVDIWLIQAEFNLLMIEKTLRKNKSLKEIVLLINTELTHVYYPDYKKIDKDFIQSFFIHKAAENEKFTNFNQFIFNAFQVDKLKVRQAISQSLTQIPLELKEDYESLLDDKSYTTIETALYNLWNNFPQERKKYLNKTKGIQGFNNKNVRILWLTLALVTEDFEPEKKKQYFKELTGYTGPKYGFEVRQNAFQYLSQIKACNEACKENLEQATKHHNWRFVKFAKEMLKTD
jgi:aminopeptidase N